MSEKNQMRAPSTTHHARPQRHQPKNKESKHSRAPEATTQVR